MLQNLDNIKLLQDLTPDQRKVLSQKCSWNRPGNGEKIITVGSESRNIFFIVSGRLRIVHYSASGREVAYCYREAGDHVGELGVLDGKPRSTCVEADESCLLAVMPASVFFDLLDRHPIVARRLMACLAGIIREVNQKAVEFGLVGAIQRVHRELLRLARPTDNGGIAVMPLPTQEELAASTCTTRETAARALAQLAKSGVTSRHGRKLLICEPRILEALANTDS